MLKRLKAKIVVFGLCVAIMFGASFGVLDFGVINAQTTPETRLDMTDVTGKYSLDEIKTSQYASGVETTPDFLKGKGSVIVKVKGDNLYDYYSGKTRSGEFSDYAASSEAKKIADALVNKQNKILSEMRRKGIDYTFKYSYTALTNAFSVVVDYSDMAKIEKISGVESVYYSNRYAVPEVTVSTNNANVYSTGIYDSSEVGYDGAGMVVAVLDTGLDYTHKAFSHMPTGTDIWDEAYINSRLGSTLAKTSRMPSVTSSDVYVNAKVPYAFDYADNDSNVYPAYSSHGTHVAGIIAGEDETKTVGEDNETFIGVAPQAQLVIMKVFTDNLDSELLGGADTDDILAAVNDCAVLGVDVINMSLGSSGGFTSEATNEFLTEVYEKVEEAGISLIVAAGNESSSGNGGGNGMNLATNPDSGTVGSPSTYGPALSVASIEGKEAPYFVINGATESAAFIHNAADVYSNDVEFVDLLYSHEQLKDKVDADGNLIIQYVVVGGVGRTANYTAPIRQAMRREPTIALVKRGDISFSDKVKNAVSAGAIGVVVYNNLSGEIRMSLADIENPPPTCSISLNEGTAMVNNAVRSVGTITLNRKFTAGPFMSSFSGLGVTPDLKLKPEITAHGGEILSAVPGGYDTYSGTSMASPNMAGAAALLRQYLEKTTSLSGKALNARVNQILMSTATIAINPDGNPYSPRKQGAGLANIKAAVETEAYLTVPDGKGGELDKTKLEFGDDVEKLGVYGGTFTAINNSTTPKQYKLSSYVFTETLAINKKTVEETAHMLNPDVKFTVNETVYSEGDVITVPEGGKIDITATVTLSGADVEYIEMSFTNGMYVEGYFRLLEVAENGTDLSLPFLGFYGDWSKAPLFDYSIYELAVTDADKTIEEEDKPKASARETTPLGLYNDGQYIMPLGSYMYNQDERNIEIFPDSDKAAISMYDDSSRRTIYQLYMIYGGLLRGAKTLHITITDAVTGELVYDKMEYNVRKAYANGGSNVGSPIMIGMNPYEWGLSNNREYIFTMKGTLDWDKDNGKADNDTFEFNFHVDYEAPSIDSYSVRFEPYNENRETKYRIYLDVNVYDNQYVQSLLPCYVKDNTLYLLSEYVIPVYSQQNSVTKVSFEITDYYDDYADDIYLGVEDYAMNQSLYQLHLKNATTYCDKLDFEQEEGKFVLTRTGTQNATVNGQQIKNEYGYYELTLSPNEAYKLNAAVLPDGTYSYKLDWTSNKESVAVAYENEIYAKGEGSAIISVRDNNGLIKAQISVKVAGEEKTRPQLTKLSFRPAINKDYNVQTLVDSSVPLELYPNTALKFELETEPWYLKNDVNITWTTSNPAVVTVEQDGTVTTHDKGSAYVTATYEGDSRIRATVQIRVVSEFRITNYTLYEYHGDPDVVIPDELNIMYLDEDCFKGNRNITSVKLPKTLTEIPKYAFMNCTGLTTVTLPSETTVVGESAFEGCVSLKTLDLLPFIDEDFGDEMTGAITVANRAFAGCISLDEIKNPLRLTTVGREAFKGCSSLETLDLRGLAVAYDSAFEGLTSLKTLKLSGFTGLADNMFKGCTSLQTVDYPMTSVRDGMFEGCSSLQTISFTEPLSYIGARAFAGTAIANFTVGSGDVRIGAYAFERNTALTTFTVGRDAHVTFAGISPFNGCTSFNAFAVVSGNAYYTADGGLLYNKDKTEIVNVPEAVASVSLPSSVTKIGNNVFAGKTSLSSFDFGRVTEIGDYAFANSGIKSVTLPSSVTRVGKGAFQNCNLLQTVDISAARITKIEDGTFAGSSITAITLPSSVTAIGNSAFENSLVASVEFGATKEVGESAFRNTRIVALVLPASVTKLGTRAFSNMPSLTSVTTGAIEEMGSRVFTDCARLARVELGTGSKVIGDFAFAWSDESSVSPLRTVDVPDSVKTIGTGAFFNCGALYTVSLGHVETIGDMAFMYAGLSRVVTSAKTIGDLAFAGTARVQNVILDNAEHIGVQAFLASGANSLTMPQVKSIGANAFTGTNLSKVNIPETLSDYSYDNTLNLFNQSSGKYEDYIVRTESVGYGAFAGIETLTSITVDKNNKTFFDDNGVLYARVANGYTLVQCPAALDVAGKEYTVLDGTVRIEADAFNSVWRVNKVTLPSDVKSIGSRAFYASEIKDYTFKSVAAPTLDSQYVEASLLPSTDILYTIFSTSSNLELGSQVFYANFVDYVAKRTEEKKLNEAGHRYTAPSFGLKITYPENGMGYDNMIWLAFFEERSTSAYAADEQTILTNRALAAMPTVSSINSAANIDALNELAANVAKARKLYNGITSTSQLELVSGYDKLVEAETAVRAKRTALGAPAKVASIKIVSNPVNRYYYVGDTLDLTGLRVVAVYDDTSEEEVTDYTVDKTGTLTTDDNRITVSYQGATNYFDIAVRTKIIRKVTFEVEGKEPVVVDVINDEKVSVPELPVRDGYEFAGWFVGETEYDFDSAVTADITLTAHWTEKPKSGCGGSVATGSTFALIALTLAAVGTVLFINGKKKKTDRVEK